MGPVYILQGNLALNILLYSTIMLFLLAHKRYINLFEFLFRVFDPGTSIVNSCKLAKKHAIVTTLYSIYNILYKYLYDYVPFL